MTITDLTNTTWVVPAGWSAAAGYGDFNITGKVTGKAYNATANTDKELSDYEIDHILIGKAVDSNMYDYWSSNCITVTPPYSRYYFKSTESFTLTITGGNDINNEELIAWLETYSEKPIPTDAVTVEYNNAVIATLTEGKVTLSCKDKQMHANLVVTVPDGLGGEEIEEWDGSYIVSSDTTSGDIELIDFAIADAEGIKSYKAETGMSWGQWVDSTYNTGGFRTVGLNIANSSGLKIAAGGSTITVDKIIKSGTFYTLVQSDSND